MKNKKKINLYRRIGFYEKIIKRIMDIVCSVLVLVMFGWLYVIIAILVRIKLGSPVLFTQYRPGLVDPKTGCERIFKIYKFRTMTDEKDEEGNLLSDDARLTKFGAWLRSTSLDELPEVFNILNGTMSIIGPRPQLVRDMVFMTEQQRKRHTARPGLSGLAQVSGRNAISWEEKFKYDLEYISNVSILKDIEIIIKTIDKAIIHKDGITDGDSATAKDLGEDLLSKGYITQNEFIEKNNKANRILGLKRSERVVMKNKEERLVSIITPAYNASEFIGEAIESVLTQTYQKWELIIVDDGSKDNTVEVVKRYTDSRIILHQLEKNSGVAVAMNTAISLAHGTLLAFLDADDVWKENKLENHTDFMITHRYGFTFSAYEIMREGKNKVVHAPKSQNYSQYMRNTVIGTSVVMLDLDIIGHDFRMVNLKKDLDSMTWAKLLREGHTAYGLDESLAYYRKVETSISNDKWKAATNHWENCRKVEKLPFLQCLYYFIGYAFNATLKHFF